MPYTDEQIIATAQTHNIPYQTLEDAQTAYNDLLDELHDTNPGDLFENYSGSTMLELIDPIAYRCGFSDYVGTNEEYYRELFVNEHVFYMSKDAFIVCVDILDAETETEKD